MTRLAFPLTGTLDTGLPPLVARTVRQLARLGIERLRDQDEAAIRVWCESAQSAMPPGVRLLPVVALTKAVVRAGDTVRLEFHRAHIDLHVCLGGVERLAVAPLESLDVNEPWQADQDVGFGLAKVTGAVDLLSCESVVLLPDDAHMPLFSPRAPAPVRKLVVKIPVEAV